MKGGEGRLWVMEKRDAPRSEKEETPLAGEPPAPPVGCDGQTKKKPAYSSHPLKSESRR